MEIMLLSDKHSFQQRHPPHSSAAEFHPSPPHSAVLFWEAKKSLEAADYLELMGDRLILEISDCVSALR